MWGIFYGFLQIFTTPTPCPVIPAKAGIQRQNGVRSVLISAELVSRLRGKDGITERRTATQWSMQHANQFDVFLSHSSQDKAIVRALAERLRDDGLKVCATTG